MKTIRNQEIKNHLKELEYLIEKNKIYYSIIKALTIAVIILLILALFGFVGGVELRDKIEMQKTFINNNK